MLIFIDKKEYDVPPKSNAGDLAEKLHKLAPDQSLAVKINGTSCDLSSTLQEKDQLSFIDFDSKEGKEIFWHTSAHVLAQAILRLFPEAKPTIGPPIEQGFYYDFANLKISDADFESIEKKVSKIVTENYRPTRHVIANKKEALRIFKNNPYKCELIEGFQEKDVITAYEQGEFFDLCRGPHLPNLGKIKAFKILKLAGAYWRGDSNREMLTRVYAISFPDRKMLREHLVFLEEAKKRDHKILGPKLDLFSIQEEAPGMPFIHPKGMTIWNRLIQFWRTMHEKAGYEEIITPQIMSQELWETSGHWEHYRKNMYAFSIEKRYFAIKPMNCPGCMLYYKLKSHSYRELPLRISELGHVHRHEASGALSGLFRVRSFHQDDAHLFMQKSDIKQEILNIIALTEETYKTFGLSYRLELSTRPKESIGSDEDWETAINGLKDALDAWGQPYIVNEADGAFYGPKIDIHIKDALSRSWQCGTIQLDMALPEKFQLQYVDSNGQQQRPIMIHRALFGSVERFMGILIEHFAGKFPLWLSPSQIRIIPVAERHETYASEICNSIKMAGFQSEVDISNETVNKKIRNAQLMQYNYILVLGDQEVKNQSINLRSRNNARYGELALNVFLHKIKQERADYSLTSYFAKEEVNA